MDASQVTSMFWVNIRIVELFRSTMKSECLRSASATEEDTGFWFIDYSFYQMGAPILENIADFDVIYKAYG